MSYIIVTEVKGFKYYIKFLDVPHHSHPWLRFEGLKNNATSFPAHQKAVDEIEFLPRNRIYTVEKY